MRLYTIQPMCIYDMLLDRGVFISYPLEHADSWLMEEGLFDRNLIAYDWLVAQMQARGLPRPAPTAYPTYFVYDHRSGSLRHLNSVHLFQCSIFQEHLTQIRMVQFWA
ncbi:hypothetical protein F2Q65_13210 [Thiohalocapsa marina]|uniref:Uncharacterized protein n=1 Tax=Thiohalocapsa marina TaxID=424902 RepID=A0A5M8FHE7_9GAMM|nr:hypothetical protein [Thiohalocapsa marina]KAA6184147.1 hypothetical protein F2Q65_13210 [Thiohalocapsa marina]